MPKLPSGKKQLNVAIRQDLLEKFRGICDREKRNQNSQLEIIIEEWIAWKDKGSYKRPPARLSVVKDKESKS